MPPMMPAPPYPEDETGGVYVRDSAIALEKLALARRMERLHAWDTAADVYQEILEKYPDRVVPRTEDPQSHEVTQYISVTETVRRSLCKWPSDGLRVYRSLYETTADKILSQVGQSPDAEGLDKLQRVLFLYFPSNAAKVAGIRLMDAYFEQGDYATVAQIGKRLLDWHPNLEAERPMVLYRTALAEKLSGQTDDAARLLGELRNHFPRAVGRVRGQDVLLADSLATDLAGANVVRDEGSDSWLTFGGDASRSKISTSTVKPGARLYAIALPQVNWKEMRDQPQRQELERNDQDQRQRGAGLDIMPAVERGQLFFQDNTRIYALDLDSGSPLSNWVNTYPMQSGQFKLPGNATPLPLGRQLCVTVSDKYVTAVMGLSDPIVQSPMLPDEQSHLVCLDRDTGRLLWMTSPRNLPDAQNTLRDLTMGGSPLIVGDNLYIILHGSRGQFEDCYVVCYALTSGQFRWASFIANSNSEMGAVFADDSLVISDAVSHLAYSSGRVFVITNLGAVAALDAYTGTIDWLDIYRKGNLSVMVPFNPGMMRAFQASPSDMPTTTVPWTYNAAVVQDGKLFALPSDGRSLLIYDAGTGNLIKQIDLGDLEEKRDSQDPYTPDIPTTLLAVRDDLVYLAGARQVWQVPWRNMDPAKPADETPQYWRSADDGDQSPQVRGRAFVTADAVYLPTRLCLKRILRSTGSLDSHDSSFPPTDWEEGQEGPGNVIVTEDHVIIAGDKQVVVYTDIQRARAKLDREIAEAPTDPEAWLHYAEVMFAAGQQSVALEKIEKAFALLGGELSLRPGPSRDRAFNDALSFARRLEPAPAASRMFDLASDAAMSVSQQVSYRMTRAAFDLSGAESGVGGAIALYQQVLADPAMRAMPMPDPNSQKSGTTRAGVVADRAIQKILITPEGRSAYEKFQQAADAALKQAEFAGDPDRLLNIARVYPDSRVAADAMLAAADVYESRGNYRMATQVLRQILLRLGNGARAGHVSSVTVLESLARNYLKMPGHVDVAVSRLALAANLRPGDMLRQPLVLPDGAVLDGVSLATARDLLTRYSANISVESLPDLHIPTHAQSDAYLRLTGRRIGPFEPPTPADTIGNVDAMIVSMEGFQRNDRIIAWSQNAGLVVYPVGQNKPAMRCPAVNQAPTGAAWIGNNLLVWTKDSIMQIDEPGHSRWSLDVVNLPAIAAADADQQPAEVEQIAQVRPLGDRVIVATSNGRVFAVDAAAGRVAWQTRLEASIDTLLANDDFTVVRFQQDQIVQLEVFNSFSGELIGKKSFSLDDGGVYPVNLALAADGTLVYTLPNQLCIQDLFQANASDGGMEPQKVSEPISSNTQIFANADEPDELLIHSGLVFALANSGREVRVFSADTAQPWQYHRVWRTVHGNGTEDSRGAADFQGVFPTGSTSPNVTLHISGNYLFMLSPRHLTACRIEPPTEHWDTGDDPIRSTNYEQLMFGRDYIVMVDHPGAPLSESNRAGSRLTLNMFSRTVKGMPPDKESGTLVFTYDLAIQQDTFAVQPVEGGIAFFTGRTIQTFFGARDTMATTPPI